MAKKSLEFLQKRAVQLGAKDSKLINSSTVKTAHWVRYKCQFGCSGFGESLTCPPYAPTPEETKKILASYKKALLIHSQSGAKVDISKIVLRIEKEAFLPDTTRPSAWAQGPAGSAHVVI